MPIGSIHFPSLFASHLLFSCNHGRRSGCEKLPIVDTLLQTVHMVFLSLYLHVSEFSSSYKDMNYWIRADLSPVRPRVNVLGHSTPFSE